MKLKKWFIRILFYVGGFLLMTLGIALSKRSGLGVSPVSTIPYTITGITLIGVSLTTVIFHAALVALQIIILGRNFKIKNFLQIPAGILFGMFTGMFQNFANNIIIDPATLDGPMHWLVAIIMCLLSTFLIAIGIFFYVPADIVPLAGEGAMLAISQRTGIKFSTVKIGFDVTMVLSSLVACIIFSGSFSGAISMGVIGLGTVVAAVLVGVNLKAVTRVAGKYRDNLLNQQEYEEIPVGEMA